MLHLLEMADKEGAGHPPLQDLNSPDYVCVTCQNRVNSLCLPCQELALLRGNSTTNERDNSDSYPPEPMSDSDKDSAYDADTIIDSPNSRSSTLQLYVSDNSNDENNVSDNNLNDEEVESIEEPAPLMPRRRPIRNRLTVLFGACAPGTTFKLPLIVRNRFDLVSNAVSNDPDDSDLSDMPPLEGSDEDDGDI